MISMRRTAAVSASLLLPQAERARIIANAARTERDALIGSGQASPVYRTLVDGRDNVPEEAIKPGGAIIYRFNTLGQAAIYGLTFARERSPAVSGTYKRSWFVAVNGKPWTGDLNDLPADANVLIVNAAPYHRKIETGHIKTIGKDICEHTRQAVRKRFPNLDAGVVYAELTGSVAGWTLPYVLKGASRSSAKRWEAHLRVAKTHSIPVYRKDTRAGQLMTYPAVMVQTRIGFG